MSEEKKVRNMSVAGFISKATSAKVSADAFLAQHRAWLQSETLAAITSPILIKLDEKVIMPTPALKEIVQVVYDHMTAKVIEDHKVKCAKEEAAIIAATNKANEPKVEKEARTTKPWTATIYNVEGKVQARKDKEGKDIDLIMNFDNSMDADEWADRRLFDGASDWFAVVNHNSMLNKEGELLSSVIMRNDAMARILRQKKSPFMSKKSSGDGKLSWSPKVSNDRAVFSRG